MIFGLVVPAGVACAGSVPPVGVPTETPAAVEVPAAATEAGPRGVEIDQPPPYVAPGEPTAGPARWLHYPPVSLADREGQLIRLVEDLVIDERPEDRRFDFDDAVGIAVDEAGRMYIHDSGRYRIVVYGADGGFERAFGGAGEMAPFRHGWIAVAGDKLAISTGNKITVWTLDGRHLYDRSLMRRAFSRDVQGTADGSLVGSFEMLDRDRRPWYSVEKVAIENDDGLTYGAVSPRPRGATSPRGRPGFVATRTGDVYLTRGDEYVIQAFDSTGAAKWIVHVDVPAVSSPAADAPPPELTVPQGGRRGPGRGHALRVDGQGNLYVFPYTDGSWQRDVVPVDVYSPEGERVFTGLISDRSWIRSLGNAVYGLETDPETDRQRIIRYRLEAPFLTGTVPTASGES